MSEEAAFLEALKANPADDTVRLVYADWLDEHAEPAKAEYLRAVVGLTVHIGGTSEYTDAAIQLFTAVAHTEAPWRAASGGRFDLMLTSIGGGYMISTIKLIREISRWGLANAKSLAEAAPCPLYSWQPFEDLLPKLLAFSRLRGNVQVTIQPTAWPSIEPGHLVDVFLTKHDYTLEPIDDDEPPRPRYENGVEGFSDLLGVSIEDVIPHLRKLPLLLGAGIRPERLAEFLRRVTMATNGGDPLPEGAIQVIPHNPS